MGIRLSAKNVWAREAETARANGTGGNETLQARSEKLGRACAIENGGGGQKLEGT
jgi:hypothetical protein